MLFDSDLGKNSGGVVSSIDRGVGVDGSSECGRQLLSHFESLRRAFRRRNSAAEFNISYRIGIIANQY